MLALTLVVHFMLIIGMTGKFSRHMDALLSCAPTPSRDDRATHAGGLVCSLLCCLVAGVSLVLTVLGAM